MNRDIKPQPGEVWIAVSEGFDASARFIGHAEWMFEGCWRVRIGKECDFCDTEQEARERLQQAGSKEVLVKEWARLS